MTDSERVLHDRVQALEWVLKRIATTALTNAGNPLAKVDEWAHEVFVETDRLQASAAAGDLPRGYSAREASQKAESLREGVQTVLADIYDSIEKHGRR